MKLTSFYLILLISSSLVNAHIELLDWNKNGKCCKTLIVALENGAKEAQNARGGTYNLKGILKIVDRI